MSGFSVQSCIQYFAFISNFSAKHTVVLCWQTFLIGWSPTLRPMREGGRAVKVTRSLTQPTGNSSCLPGPRCSGGGGWVMGKNTFCHTLIRGTASAETSDTDVIHSYRQLSECVFLSSDCVAFHLSLTQQNTHKPKVVKVQRYLQRNNS